MRNFVGFIYGMIYGVAHIVPGLSGGTFLVIFGCYDVVCEAFALNITAIRKNFLFLMLFGIGTMGGLIVFAHIITFLFVNFAIQTNLFFMGLILGGIPLISKIATKEERFKPICIVPFSLGLALVVSLFLLERTGLFDVEATETAGLIYTTRIVFYSFIAAIAMIMPGISGAFILVVFGVYDIFMEAVRVMDFTVIVPAAIGILIGIVIGAKLVLLLLHKFKLMVYSAIIGMVAGSIIPLLPEGFGINIATLTGIVFLILGGSIALFMGKKEAA